jgi:hypothetical protein
MPGFLVGAVLGFGEVRGEDDYGLVVGGAPRVSFFRPFGAGCEVVGLTHGLRRGLRSCAPSELGLGLGSFRDFLA